RGEAGCEGRQGHRRGRAPPQRREDQDLPVRASHRTPAPRRASAAVHRSKDRGRQAQGLSGASMAHKKGVGSSRNGRDSGPKYLGVKRFAGEFVTAGTIIVRQRGTKFHPGTNVRRASDDSLFTVVDGVVKFEHKNKKRYRVSVYPPVAVNEGGTGPVEDGRGGQKRAVRSILYRPLPPSTAFYRPLPSSTALYHP